MPACIAIQFDKLSELEKNIKKSISLADVAFTKAEDANKKVGMFNQVDSIKKVQQAAKGLAEAQITAAQAQELLFNYQNKLCEITKGLFTLGVSNIAANRTVVKNIRMHLQGASETELSELARQELVSVISQLKAQEDIMNKQTKISRIVKGHDNQIKNQISKANEQEQLLRFQKLKDEEHDLILSKQFQKDEEHDRILSERIQKDKEHDRILIQQLQKNEEHDRILAQHVKMIEKTNSRVEEIVRQQSEEIDELKGELNNLENILKQNLFKALTIIAFVMAFVSLVFGTID